MAKDDTVVDLPDPDADVVVELSEDDLKGVPPDPAVLAEAEETGAAPQPPKKTPRVRLSQPESGSTPAPQPAAEEAATALAASLKAEQERSRHLEATAAAERAAREDADRRAAQSAAEASAAKEQVLNRELSIVSTGIDSAQGELETLKGDLTRLYEAGEFAKVADVQVRIGTATAKLDRLQEAKATIEANASKRATTGRVEPTSQPQASSLFERYVSQFAPASQAWLRAHPECAPAEVGGSAAANAKMMAAHYSAVANNIAPNTPDYFRAIEEQLGATPTAASPLSAAAQPAPAAPKAATPQRQVPRPSAPPSREAPSVNIPRNVQQVTLSKEQQEAARLSFPHLETKQAYTQYALNLIELTNEGKMNRTTH